MHSRVQKSDVELAGDDLFNFAIDREDIKSLTALLPKESECKPEAIEYELQLLKIISTGWSISFFLENSPHRDQLAEIFWRLIHEFSGTLSETTQLMTGKDINYFQILNDRLDMYVDSLNKKPDAKEPAAVIGPEFARFCGSGDDVFAVMTGSRMFIMTMARVKEFLKKIGLK
ncbi:MAG: hypothetical protein JRF02_02910 [Deltaproteobacteria bacterium]|nr:hypothetical protein [Deltaproteobacteria bacterium]